MSDREYQIVEAELVEEHRGCQVWKIVGEDRYGRGPFGVNNRHRFPYNSADGTKAAIDVVLNYLNRHTGR